MKSLIFDLDGTLWDARLSVVNSWNIVLNRLGYKTITINELTPYVGLPQKEIIKNLFNINDEKASELELLFGREEIDYLMKNGGILYDNVVETLKKLSKNSDLFIVSNCQDRYIETFLDYYNLRSLFKDFESAGRTRKNKTENINLILKRNNKSDAIYIGDTDGDYIAAKNNNLFFIYAKYGFGDVSKFDLVINDFKELNDLNL